MTKEKANKALLRAAEDCDVEALNAALVAGADVNAVDEFFFSHGSDDRCL